MEQRLVSFRSIEAAINRGVQLEVYGQQHSNVERLVSRHRASNQIRGWCWNQERGDLFHIKGIVVDNVRVYIGSANLSQNGLNTALSGELSQKPRFVHGTRALHQPPYRKWETAGGLTLTHECENNIPRGGLFSSDCEHCSFRGWTPGDGAIYPYPVISNSTGMLEESIAMNFLEGFMNNL